MEPSQFPPFVTGRKGFVEPLLRRVLPVGGDSFVRLMSSKWARSGRAVSTLEIDEVRNEEDLECVRSGGDERGGMVDAFISLLRAAESISERDSEQVEGGAPAEEDAGKGCSGEAKYEGALGGH